MSIPRWRLPCCLLARREGEIGRKRDLSAQAACKRLEILYATRLARADKLSARFLLTQTGPPLYYCPAKPSQETAQLAEAQRQAHQLWKAGEMERLEREKAQLMARLTQPPRQRGQQQQRPGEAEQQQGEGEEEPPEVRQESDVDVAMVGAEAVEEEEEGSDEDMQAQPSPGHEQQQEQPAQGARQQQQPAEPQAPAPEAEQPQQGAEESGGEGDAALPIGGAEEEA